MKIAIVAGEHSGDQLGFKLMRAMRDQASDALVFRGVGGERMEAEGLDCLFPLSDIAVMGLIPVIKRLPTVLRRIRDAADAIIAWNPDLLIIIDSPDFTHRVARRVRRACPDLPVVNYVSPTVWAWRPGRARTMRGYVNQVLALFPFEPAAHERLGGPRCDYVGHPLIERMAEFRPNPEERALRDAVRPVVVVLPGSRRAEISLLTKDFGDALGLVAARVGSFDLVLPAVDYLAADIEARVADWPVRPRIVRGEAAKLLAFRQARAALATSGSVTLELALAGVPMVVAYKVQFFERWLRYVITVSSIVLANLILGENAIPEFLQEKCTPERLAAALTPLLQDGPVRDAQIAALAKLDGRMMLDGGDTPSERAARISLETIRTNGRYA